MADAPTPPPQTFTVRPVYRFSDGTEHTARLELAQPSMDAVHAFGQQHGGEFVGFADPSDTSREVVPSQPTAPTQPPQEEGFLRSIAPTAAQMVVSGGLGLTGAGAPIAIPAGIAAASATDALLGGQGSAMRGAEQGVLNDIGGYVGNKVFKGVYRGAKYLAPEATGALERGVQGVAERVFGKAAIPAGQPGMTTAGTPVSEGGPVTVRTIEAPQTPAPVPPPAAPGPSIDTTGRTPITVGVTQGQPLPVPPPPQAALFPGTKGVPPPYGKTVGTTGPMTSIAGSGDLPLGGKAPKIKAEPLQTIGTTSGAKSTGITSPISVAGSQVATPSTEELTARWIKDVGRDPKTFVSEFNKLSPEQAVTIFGPERVDAFRQLNTVLSNAVEKTSKHPGDLLQAGLGVAGSVFGAKLGLPSASRAVGGVVAALPVVRGAQQKIFSQLLSSPKGIRLLASSVDAAASGVGEAGATVGRALTGAAQSGLFSSKAPPPLPDYHTRRQ